MSCTGAEQVAKYKGPSPIVKDVVENYLPLALANESSVGSASAQQLSQAGVSLHPGESIRYVITDAKARAPHARARSFDLMDSSCGYDVEKYAELLLRAMTTILHPADLDQEQIEQKITQTQSEPSAWQIPLEWFVPINRRDVSKVGQETG